MQEAERSPKFDRISELPLLVHILLLVPTKVAVATTIWSKRWRFVWTKLPRLEYKDRKKNSKSVWWFLDESMRFHSAPLLEKLFIELGPQCPVDVDVVKWVAKVFDRCLLRQLIFKLHWKSEPIIMPKCLYTCKTLTRLILSNKILVDAPCPVYLPSLYQLDLLEVVYKDEDSHVRLLSGCPVLKRLHVSRRDDVDDNVRKFTVKVPSLLRLTYMSTCFQEDDDDEDDDTDDRSLVIDTPDLIYLEILDCWGQSCSIEYMPHLRRASIDNVLDPVDNLLRSLSSVERLVLSPVYTMIPWCKTVYSLLRKCTISQFDPDWCEPLVILLSNCPKLEVFMVDSIFGIDGYENLVPVLWNQPSSVPKCLSSHLQDFKWKGYVGREDEKEVIRYILENSKCLKTAGISLNSTCNLEEGKKMIEELESMPRVSTSSLLLFSAEMVLLRISQNVVI